MRYEIIHEMKDLSPVTWLVEIAEVKRSSFYKWVKTYEDRQGKIMRDQILKDKILTIHMAHKEYGYSRMEVALKEEGWVVNHKRVYRLMKEMGIQSIIRKKRRYFGRKASKVYPNLVNREFKQRKEKEVLVTDITYIPFQNRFYYLSVVQDLYNNEIVSWKLSNGNNLKLVLDTIEDLHKKTKRARNHPPFGSGIPVHVQEIQQTIKEIWHKRQPLSQRKLPR